MTWIEEGLFAAGGDHLPQAWGEFAAQTGIGSVVHQRPGAPSPFLGQAPRSFLWLDVADESQADSALRWQAGSFVLTQLRAGDRVLLHASQGRHRIRWVYVAYRLCRGQDLAGALRLAEKRPWLAPYHTGRQEWEAFAVYVQRQRAGEAA